MKGGGGGFYRCNLLVRSVGWDEYVGGEAATCFEEGGC